MNSRELIEKVFHLEEVERVPWVPFVGVHAGHLLGLTAEDFLKSETHIVNGVSKAIELYNPDGIPVVFDLQVEAEAMGCELVWADNNPPAVSSHPLLEGKNIGDLKIPGTEDGRIGMIMNAARTLRERFPDIALYGLITGPFTLALHLLGTEIFIKMLEDPEYVHELLDFTKKVSLKMAGYYLDAGCDVIPLVDPMTSQIDPVSFRTFVSPPAGEIFEYIRQRQALSSFFVCGYAQQNVEAMCDCRPDNISIDENIPLDYVKEVALPKGISFGGNMKLTVVLLMGTEETVQREALECLDLGGNRGFILAPGCDVPMDTPVRNLQAVTELVHDTYRQEVLRTLEQKEEVAEILDMKDYGHTDKVIVDIITLDSSSCAPCQYMVEAVKRVAPHFEGIVEWREHPIKDMESVTFMSSLMVKNIPTICIDGKIAFVSKIPPKQELIAAIQKRINEKLKLKIKSRRGEILVLGRNDRDFEELSGRLKQAVRELGKDVDVKYITDSNQIAAFGISETPAVVLAEYKLKAEGNLPSVEVIKEWIKEM